MEYNTLSLQDWQSLKGQFRKGSPEKQYVFRKSSVLYEYVFDHASSIFYMIGYTILGPIEGPSPIIDPS